MLKAKLGIAPIAWWNDDLVELSDDVSLDECLRQASVAGFTGMETGRRFPMDMGELGPILDRHGVSLCGGWHSGHLLEGDIEAEKERIRPIMDLFIAAEGALHRLWRDRPRHPGRTHRPRSPPGPGSATTRSRSTAAR